MNGYNFCVVNEVDGGELLIEECEECKFKEVFLEGLEEGDWEEVSLKEGLEKLKHYFVCYGEGDFEENKETFLRRIGKKKGKCFMWSVECDYELMFIEEES